MRRQQLRIERLVAPKVAGRRVILVEDDGAPWNAVWKRDGE